jgi:hypothetical protein
MVKYLTLNVIIKLINMKIFKDKFNNLHTFIEINLYILYILTS